MFRLIALYIYYRNLQEERAHPALPVATHPARIAPNPTLRADNDTVHALAA
jgi:hypothetical protein